jgi:ubiquinone/menaquinone biosynthesis C-methylase UbiE
VRVQRNDIDPSKIASNVIESVGVKRGQTVLDFGCGSGTYTIPLAGVVGKRGRVLALDKDRYALDNLMRKADSVGLVNITRLDTLGGNRINLADNSVDVVLLFDVFHHYYFSSVAERQDVLREIGRILKSGGILSVYPKHMETEARSEIESAGFSLKKELSVTLIHDKTNLEGGQVLNFKKADPLG